MSMRTQLRLRTLLAALLLIEGIGLLNRPLSAQEVKPREELRPDQMADLVAAGLSPSLLYPLPGEVVHVTARVRNRGTRTEQNLIVTLFAGSAKIASQAIDLNGGETRTLYF